MKTLIIGGGEVGTALSRVLKDYSPDIQDIDNWLEGGYEIMHVCIPWSDNFYWEVKKYKAKFDPKYTVIHSTVPPGTSRSLGALHSPIRGCHPYLEESIKTFEKFIGGGSASDVADYFRRVGIKIILCDKQETTELGKLLDTEYYRTVIEFVKRSKELSDQYSVPFHEAYTLFNLTYNEGYTKLGHPEYVRPTLQAIMKEIGGHCLLPNKRILDEASKTTPVS